jgi:hypothetical protein
MNPIFHLIVWMFRKHGAFVSGLYVYVAVPLIACAWDGAPGGRKPQLAIRSSW